MVQLFGQIMEFVVNRSLAKLIQQVIDEDGRVKDSAVCYWQMLLYCNITL